MLIDLQSLYETLLVGSCPCHGFTNVPGHTGGFYHIVCRHGVSMRNCVEVHVVVPTFKFNNAEKMEFIVHFNKHFD